MSEQRLSANPEFLFHYQRLRRHLVLAAPPGLCAADRGGRDAHWCHSAWQRGSSGQASRPRSSGVIEWPFHVAGRQWVAALYRSGRPISDDEVARQRQEERQQLFQFAQGHISWRYWAAVAVQAVIGLIFLALGLQGAWSLFCAPKHVDFLDMLLSFACVLVGWYSLSKAIGRARSLRRLTKISSQELAARLSMGEATEGE